MEGSNMHSEGCALKSGMGMGSVNQDFRDNRLLGYTRSEDDTNPEGGLSISERKAEYVDESDVGCAQNLNDGNLQEGDEEPIPMMSGFEYLIESMLFESSDGLDILGRKTDSSGCYSNSAEVNSKDYHTFNTDGIPIPRTQTYSESKEEKNIAENIADKNNDEKNLSVTDFSCATNATQNIDQSETNSDGRNNIGLSEDKKNYECDTCGKSFQFQSQFTQHNRIHTGEKPFKCGACGKAYKHSRSLYKHSKIHIGFKPFKCKFCGMAFPLENILIRHERAHTGSKSFQCSFCFKVFSDYSNCKSHMTIHTGSKPFECNVCSKKFRSSSNCTTHQKTHGGVKEYQCDSCDKKFTSLSNRNAHVIGHMDIKPYQCDVCGQGFALSSRFKKHMDTHTAVLKYMCKVCGKCFRYNTGISGLERHEKENHKKGNKKQQKK